MVFRLVISVTIIFNAYSAFSQSTAVDSLTNLVSKQRGTQRYETQIELIRKLVLIDYRKGLEVAWDAHRYALSAGDSFRIVQSGRIIGQLNNYLSDVKAAKASLESVLPTAERLNEQAELMKIYDNLGIAYSGLDEYDRALTFHHKAYLAAEIVHDNFQKGTIEHNIATLNFRMDNFREALRHYKASIHFKLLENDTYDIDRTYLNIGTSYNHLDQFDSAKIFLDEAFKICKSNCNDVMTASINHAYGISAFGLDEFSIAKDYFNKSLKAADNGNHDLLHAQALYWLAKIDLVENQMDAGRLKLLEVERIGRELNARSLLQVTYKLLADTYDQEKDFTNSAFYLKKYIEIRDSIYSSKVIDNITRERASHLQRENFAIIKARELTIKQQRNFNYAIVVIAMMTAGFGFFLFITNRRINQMNKKLTSAQNVIFEQNRKLEVRNRELDELVEKKTQELKLVNLSLKQMNDELDTFITRTAEDIRAPLASLKGICNVALKDIQEDAPLVYLHKINSTTELLNSILKRLLALNKINHSKISVSEIDIKSLVESILGIQQQKGLPQNLIIQKNIEPDIVVTSDRELLSVVLENSIDNAMKYCMNSPRSDHFINIIVKRIKNGRISFNIVDNGLGIDQFAIPELDELFMNLPNGGINPAERKDLYFVKTAAKKIGGKVNLNKTVEGYNELSVII